MLKLVAGFPPIVHLVIHCCITNGGFMLFLNLLTKGKKKACKSATNTLQARN